MRLYLPLIYMHILFAIFWVGYAMYWFFIVPPLKNEFNQRAGHDLINQIACAKWPPGSIPSPLRLKFSGIGLVCIAALAVTGSALLYLRGFTLQEITSGHLLINGLGLVGVGKLSLVGIMIFAEFFSNERSTKQARLVFLMTLIIVGISVLLVR